MLHGISNFGEESHLGVWTRINELALRDPVSIGAGATFCFQKQKVAPAGLFSPKASPSTAETRSVVALVMGSPPRFSCSFFFFSLAVALEVPVVEPATDISPILHLQLWFPGSRRPSAAEQHAPISVLRCRKVPIAQLLQPFLPTQFSGPTTSCTCI